MGGVATQRVVVMRRLAALTLASFVALAVAGASSPGSPNRDSRAGPMTTVGDMPDVGAAAAAVQQRIDEYLAGVEAERVAVEAYLEAMRPRIAVDWERWQRLHVCEQRDTWYANGGNAADPAHQTFQGGLGMSTVAWQMAVRAAASRGVVLPASALAASPEEQMTGAQAFYDAHGWAWACRV